jgi:hypothetical protein
MGLSAPLVEAAQPAAAAVVPAVTTEGVVHLIDEAKPELPVPALTGRALETEKVAYGERIGPKIATRGTPAGHAGPLREAIHRFGGERHLASDHSPHSPLRRAPRGVMLHVPADLASVVLEPATSGVEGIANRHGRVFVRVILRRIAPDHEIAARDGEVDANVDDPALAVSAMSSFDDDATPRDAAELLEALGMISNRSLQRLGRFYPSKSDL